MTRSEIAPASLAGVVILALVTVAALAAPALAPYEAGTRFADHVHAPPTWPHVRHEGTFRAPFIYPWRLVDRLEQRYEQDRTRPVPLAWFDEGRLVRSADDSASPFLLLGADRDGRDVLGRLLRGARTSLALAFAATLGALLIGAFVGSVAGIAGRAVDDVLMRVAEFVIVLPTVYVVLVLRGALPLVLPPGVVFGLMAGIFSLAGWPFVARGVRGIISSEGAREYAVAARSLGAGRARLVLRHLLPACTGFLAVQATLLVPAFIVAEATLSYVGLGFSDPVASWGAMLREAADVTFADFPWTLAPAGAIFLVVLAFNLLVQAQPLAARGPAR